MGSWKIVGNPIAFGHKLVYISTLVAVVQQTHKAKRTNSIHTTLTAFFTSSWLGPVTNACNGSFSPGSGKPGRPLG